VIQGNPGRDLRSPGKAKLKYLGAVVRVSCAATGSSGGALTVIRVSTSTGLAILA